MARWTAGAKWAAGPALDGQRDMPLALRLSEGLGLAELGEEGVIDFKRRHRAKAQLQVFQEVD